MSRQKWCAHVVTDRMNLACEKLQGLRRVSKAMQEENPVGIPLLHINTLGAGNRAGFDFRFGGIPLG